MPIDALFRLSATGSSIETAVAKALAEPEAHGQFVLDVERFTEKARTLTTDLGSFGSLLRNSDCERFGEGAVLGTWGSYHQDCLDLLRNSQSMARNLGDLCDKHLEAIVEPTATLTNSTDRDLASVQVIVQRADEFINDTKGMETKAAKIRDGFGTLGSRLKTFRTNLSSFGERHESGNRTKIHEYQRMIDDANEKIRILQTMAAWAIFDMIEEQKAKIRQFNEGKSPLESENYQIERTRDRLTSRGNVPIEDVLACHEFIRVLWAEISADVQSIKGYLEKIKRRTSGDMDPNDYPKSVFTFLKTGTTLYYGLSRGLREYADANLSIS